MVCKILVAIILFFFVYSPCMSQSRIIMVDKSNLQLYVIEGVDTLLSAPVCIGANYGNKLKTGDRRTPEGSFWISQIQNASEWEHDFGDGKGMVRGAYGPWFFRLKIPQWTSIGIHGTDFPESIGTRVSEGCVRLKKRRFIKAQILH